MKTVSINLNKIDKTAIFEGKNGKYLTLCLFDNKDGEDQYGNHGFVTVDLGKERRLAGEKSAIIGNFKDMDKKQDKPVSSQKPGVVVSNSNDWDEDDSSIPF